MLLDIVGTALASMITIVIAKTRCVTRFECCSAAFNDPHIFLDTIEKQNGVKFEEESFKTGPLPTYPYHTKPLPVHQNLRQLT